MRKANLPFQLVDRYDLIQPRPKKIEYVHDFDSIDWDKCRDLMDSYGLMFDHNQYETLFDIARNGEGE